MRLCGKSIVVTGGASGIGRAAVRCCTREGARVAVLDLDREGVAAAVREVEAGSGTALGISVDVREAEAVGAAMAQVEAAFGRIDGLIHAAGVLEGAYVPVDLFEEATWDRVLDVNLKGSFLAARHAVPALERAGGGAIVLIASGAGVRGGSSSVAYGSSKGGVHGLSLVLAAQLESRKIRVHAVCPGSIDTPLKRRVVEAGARASGRPPANPGAGLADPEGVGKVLAFLVSDEAAYVRGTVFTR